VRIGSWHRGKISYTGVQRMGTGVGGNMTRNLGGLAKAGAAGNLRLFHAKVPPQVCQVMHKRQQQR
jgi:hypothetical protein